MEPLASSFDLADMPGVDLADRTEAQIHRLLELATSAVVAELGWDPRQSVRVLHLRPMARLAPVFLPAMNVTAVTTTVDAVVLAPLDWLAPASTIYLDQAVVTSGTVTYTAGWTADDMPDAIQDACLLIAVDALDNPRRLRTWQVDTVSETYADGSSQGRDPRLAAYRLWAMA